MKKILILSALISGTALAGDLSVKDCLIQEVIPGKQMTGGFFVLENSGKDTVKLIGASVEKITDKVELHEMIHKDGQMEMSQIQSYDVTPGEHLFKKGGYHIMFMDVKQFPKAGETCTWDDFTFEVLRMDRARVAQIRMTRTEGARENPDAS